jgi:catechol 2,3-dioxygenase
MTPSNPLRDESGNAPFGPIDPGITIGYVYLKVADLPRALDFCCGVLGFELTQRLALEGLRRETPAS